MRFKEFLLEVTQHAFKRLEFRLINAARHNPELIPNVSELISEIEKNLHIAEIIYNVGKSWAVQIVPTFSFLLGEERAYDLKNLPDFRNEKSNGDMCIAIIRPSRDIKMAETTTFMFRRSPQLGRWSQPFTKEALVVDKVRTYEQFIADINSPQKQQLLQKARRLSNN